MWSDRWTDMMKYFCNFANVPKNGNYAIYLLYYTIPSTQHKTQSYRYMFRNVAVTLTFMLC